MKLKFSRQIFEKMRKYQISCKSVQWEPSCSMRTEMTKLIVVFRNCANAPKNDNAMLVHSLLIVTTMIYHKGQVKMILHHVMKAHGTGDIQFHSFWSSDLNEDEWSTAGPGRCKPAKEPRHQLNSRLGGLQYRSERFGPARTRTPDRPARSLVTTLGYLVSWF